MSGIYLHIPFCKQACHYCNFHFSTSLRLKGDLLTALKKELSLRADYLSGKTIETVYFGGGTPSLLSVEELMDLWQVIEKNFHLGDDLEITLEANPDDLSPERLSDYRHYTPINRLSIGIQSFHEADLRYMNRAHNAHEALICIENSMAAGFDKLSIDLIYGTPTMNDAQWRDNLQRVFALKVPHISCYALTVEPKTALQHLIIKGEMTGVEEEHSAQQFEILLESMRDNGYEQYEISNFCLPPHYAKHNSSYWKGAHYLGVGPSAHSFNGVSRQWNIANNAKYIKALEGEQEPYFEIEELSRTEQYNEYLLTSLRTKWGVNPEHLRKNWGVDAENGFLQQIHPYLSQGLMANKDGHYVLSDAGKLLADHIISELFW